MRGGRRRYARSIAGLQAVLGASAVVALTADLGAASPAADFANDWAPCWIGTALVAAAALLPTATRRGRLMILLALVPIVPALVRVTAEVMAAARASAAPARHPLRLLQFNAYKANVAPARAVAWIAGERPDIVVMEEALGEARAIVRGLAPLYPHQVSCLSHMRCSTVILSRVPMLASGGLARGDPENRKTISAAWASFAGAGGPFTVLAVHLGHGWPFGDQTAATWQLADFIAQADRRRIIVSGDFNLTPWTFAMRRQDAAFGLTRLTRAVPSWPAARVLGIDTPPLMPIDHVYAGPDWRSIGVRRGPWIGSDHYPLVAVLDDGAAVPSRIASMKP